MVLYRRKPVVFEPVPKNVRDETEVWTIAQTGEVFNDYEKFLNRRDFYEQRKFTCESTGHTGFTYFQALESETEASKEINSILPDALKSRILHHVQFDNTYRMDDLVNQVFDYFKEFFLVNDRVSIEGEPTRRFGRIIEMTDHSRLNNMFASATIDESLRPYIYVIQMDDNDERVTKYKASELQRDRRFYSKIILKQFLRGAITRDSSVGSLWMVRENLAKRYGIPTKIPDPKARESLLAQRRAANGIVLNGFGPPEQHPYPPQLPNGHAPQVNGHRPQIAGPGQSPATFVNFSPNGPHQYVQDPGRPPLIHHHLPHIHGHGPPPGFALYHQPPIFNGPAPQHSILAGPFIQPNLLPHIAQLVQQNPMAVQHLVTHYQTSFPHTQPQAQPSQPQVQNIPQRTTKIYEPIKYPMEDLEIKQPRTEPVRPPLKFFSDDVPEGMEARPEEQKTGILMKSVGPLLCAWETLNVHDTIYSLDSFTFDDFVDAMRFSHEEIECELFVEVHCSILKQIVNDSGKILAPIPKMAEAEESEDDGSSEEATPTPEPEPPVRTTRSSLRKSEAQQLVKQRTPTPEPPKEIHRAEAFSQEFNWVEQCQIRNFRQGGWQAIVVGLLYQLSFDPLQKDACDEILAQLVPATEDPSVESIAANYVDLDPNLRVSALNLILRLTVVTEAFREQLVLAGQEMTRLRKEKIDHQRRRKELADEYSKLELERKILLPANTPASPTLQAKEDVDMDTTMTSITSDTKEGDDPEDEDAEETKASKARLRHTQKNKRKAAAEEARKEKAKRAKAEAEKTKKQKEWEKLLDAIEKKDKEIKECEANINELDDDLRETLVHRSKVLGKDRFLNKYYWFEHNGMPFGGVPTSSTAEYGYANGRLWVQGPDEYEFQPNMEEPAISQDKERFGFTIPQRKAKEEGETHLTKSSEWAYYDDPQDIDKLLLWLDERGVREKALRKELQIFRDRIAEYMEIMKKHLSDKEKSEEEEEEETTTRISTRNKTYIDKDNVKDRCLLWTNSIMREELGYNHSEEYEPPRKAKAKAVKATKGKGRR